MYVGGQRNAACPRSMRHADICCSSIQKALMDAERGRGEENSEGDISDAEGVEDLEGYDEVRLLQPVTQVRCTCSCGIVLPPPPPGEGGGSPCCDSPPICPPSPPFYGGLCTVVPASAIPCSRLRDRGSLLTHGSMIGRWHGHMPRYGLIWCHSFPRPRRWTRISSGSSPPSPCRTPAPPSARPPITLLRSVSWVGPLLKLQAWCFGGWSCCAFQ